MKRILVIVALAVGVLVPAASANSSAGVGLALVPLPSSALPAAGRHLPIARDSGVVSNAEAADQATGNVTAKRLKRLGRVSGYLLDYGDPFGSGAGIREIQTEIDSYRSAAAARKGFAFWERDALKKPPLKGIGLRLSHRRLRLSGLPKPNVAFAETLSIKGLRPITGADAQLQHGRYILDVSVSAGSNAAAARLLPTVARRLEQRLRLALAGRLRTKSVELPPPLKPGPPPHGPKPASLVLRTADVGQGSKVLHKGYTPPKSSFDKNALSVYNLTIASGDGSELVSQQVLVGGTKLEVRYFAAIAIGGVTQAFGSGGKVTPVDLGDVGDNARGELLKVVANGRTAYEAAIVLTRGSYLDFLVLASASTLTAADVHTLAHVAAKRLNAGPGG